jgi:hypothetical protein
MGWSDIWRNIFGTVKPIDKLKTDLDLVLKVLSAYAVTYTLAQKRDGGAL